jgi:hypothetical protein
MTAFHLVILALMVAAPAHGEDDDLASKTDSLLSQSGYISSANDVCIAVKTDRIREKCLPDQAEICPTNFANFPKPESGSRIEVRVERSSLKNLMFLFDCFFHWHIELPDDHEEDRLQPLRWQGTVGSLDRMDLVTEDGTTLVFRANPEKHRVVVRARER